MENPETAAPETAAAPETPVENDFMFRSTGAEPTVNIFERIKQAAAEAAAEPAPAPTIDLSKLQEDAENKVIDNVEPARGNLEGELKAEVKKDPKEPKEKLTDNPDGKPAEETEKMTLQEAKMYSDIIVSGYAEGLKGGLNWYAQNDPKAAKEEFEIAKDTKARLSHSLSVALQHSLGKADLNPWHLVLFMFLMVSLPMFLQAFQKRKENRLQKELDQKTKEFDALKQAREAEKQASEVETARLQAELAKFELNKKRELDRNFENLQKRAANAANNGHENGVENLQTETPNNGKQSTQLDLKDPKNSEIKEQLKQQALKLHFEGRTQQEISSIINVNQTTISSWINRFKEQKEKRQSKETK